MATDKFDFLLVGGGPASVAAAETLRAEGATGSIAILSAEDMLPYHRPPLSKRCLTSDVPADRLLIQPAQFYRDKAISLLLSRRAVAVDTAAHVVHTDSGAALGYGKLLLATGGTSISAALPGAALAGIHTLRTYADALALRQAALAARRAVIVGGSFIGIEVASSLVALGLEVTVLDREPALMSKLYAPILSQFFAAQCAAHKVTVALATEVASFEGVDRVIAVVTDKGVRLPCDLVVLGIGIVPAVSYLTASGIEIDNGVLVDDRLQSSAPDVFAAGDIANFFDPVFAMRRRIEHWDNAVKHGRLAARNMLGRNLFYDEVSYFFSDVFDFSFDTLGAPEVADTFIARGALERGSFGLFYLRNDVIRAMFILGRPPDEIRAVEGLIRYRVNIAPIAANLPDEAAPLDVIPTQTVLILQGGGALGAFEAGVARALEELHIYPDIVAGVSIGAFNGAIIAGNPRNATAALDAFWNDLSVATPDLYLPGLTRAAVAWQILTLGVPNFFKPRWLGEAMPFANLPTGWTSLYDTSPVRALITKYVDFPRLKTSPVRLLVSAVNVETGELETFDSYCDDLTPDHILASGSLPPGFPWTAVGGRYYWDGGIVSNSPLDLVIERCGPAGKRFFVVDLFAGRRKLPANLLEVMARRDEIIYAERVRNDVKTREVVADFRQLVDEVMSWLDAESANKARHRPRYIELMGNATAPTMVRIVREGEPGEPSSRDYDFSAPAVRRNREEGYKLARRALGL